VTKTRQTENSGTTTPTTAPPEKKPDRAKILKKMMNHGFHLGHPTRKWNPKMAPYLYGKLDGAHIIDITQSLSQMRKVWVFLRKASSEGKTFLFVGTKRQINEVVKDAAIACDALYVTQRWLGGMLTNLETMLPALRRLELLQLTERSGMAEPPSRSAKEEARRLRKRERLEKYFGGLVKMRRLPDVVIIVGQPDERNAVLECKKLGIKTVTLLDSDCDPTLTDYFVSANDDSPGSVQVV
jgi:small subunit ribosomal protein S2